MKAIRTDPKLQRITRIRTRYSHISLSSSNIDVAFVTSNIDIALVNSRVGAEYIVRDERLAAIIHNDSSSNDRMILQWLWTERIESG